MSEPFERADRWSIGDTYFPSFVVDFGLGNLV